MLDHRPAIACVIVTCAVLIGTLSVAQGVSARPNALARSTTVKRSSPRPVSQLADQLLKDMGAYIGSAKEFTFHADITFDHVLPSGQKVQYSANEEVVVRRPNRLYVEWDSDLGSRQLWYDGKSVTLSDPSTPFYASETAPSDLDGMLEQLVGKLNFAPPLADLLYRDPYGTLRRNIRYGFDLGQTEVDGRNCRSFAFVEKDIDWQIWIENGPQLTPCKIVITYKTHPSQPQFTAVFSDWNFVPRIADRTFVPNVPAGTQKVQFENVVATK